MIRSKNRDYDNNALDWVANLPKEELHLLSTKVPWGSTLHLIVLERGQFTRLIRQRMIEEDLSAWKANDILNRLYQQILAKQRQLSA